MSEQPHLHQSTRSDETSIVRGKDATEQPRENPAGDAQSGPDAVEEVLTLVCETCGENYFYSDAPPPENMSCAKCGGQVFRAFDASVGDEALDDFRDATERDLDPDDAEGGALPGDLMDLDNI